MKKIILIVVFIATLVCFNKGNAQDSTNFQAIRSSPMSKYDQVESIQTWFGVDSGYAWGTFVYIMNNDLIIGTVDSLGRIAFLDSTRSIGILHELINGHIYTTDSNQYKYRASYTLTSTGADTIWQDTAYGNYDIIYACYSDTGASLDDSIAVEIYDPLLAVWIPIGVKCLYNGNDYTIISPGGGNSLKYELGLGSRPDALIDIFRFRMINTQVGVTGRTGTISWWGKADK